MPAAAPSSSARTPESSDPQGKQIVSSSTRPHELGGRALGGRDDEQRVGEAALPGIPRRTPRHVGHRAADASMPMTERGRLASGEGRGRPTVAGPEIDEDPVRGGDPWSELADVHLEEATADDAAHDRRTLHFARVVVRSPDRSIRASRRLRSGVGPASPGGGRARHRDHRLGLAGPARSSTSAARPSRACPARGSWTWGRRPTPPTSRRSQQRCMRSGSGHSLGPIRGRRPGPCTSGRIQHDGEEYRIHFHVHQRGDERPRQGLAVPRRAPCGPGAP